jgi:hypothetical protein
MEDEGLGGDMMMNDDFYNEPEDLTTENVGGDTSTINVEYDPEADERK